MTDRSGWSDQQINAYIAMENDFAWRYRDDGDMEWSAGDGSWQNTPPDYTHSWELCGELLEEMPISYSIFALRSSGDKKRNLCEQYLAWKEQECTSV